MKFTEIPLTEAELTLIKEMIAKTSFNGDVVEEAATLKMKVRDALAAQSSVQPETPTV